MHVIFPMAGEGSRFGYKFKPFIKATEETFIEIAKKPFDVLGDPTFVFAYRRVQERDYMVSGILEDIFPSSKMICSIIEDSDGPLQTLQQVVIKEGLKGPAFVCDCDHSIDISPMLPLPECDVLVPTWNIEPADYPSFGKVKFDKYGRVSEFCEKETPELGEGETLKGILGCYYFPDVSIVTKYPSYNDISSMLKEFLKENKKILTVDIRRADFFGTPKQLNEYRFSRAQTYTLFLDIDGLLVHQDTKTLLPNTYSKISEWRSQGHKVILTTASPNYSSNGLKAKIPHDGFLTGLSPGPRIVINDKKPYCPFYSMAEGIALERNAGLAQVDLAAYKPKKILKEFDGGSFANTFMLTDGTVRKYITKTPQNAAHVDVLKRQYEDLKRLRYITKDLVPNILGSRETSSDFYYDLEYLDGYDMLCNFDVETQNSVIELVTRRMFSEVYCFHRPIADPKKWLIEYLEKRVFPKLPSDEGVEINGVSYEPIRKTLLDLAPHFAPEFECQIHGDLSLENIMWNPDTRDVKLIDCAGSSYVDTVYLDLGKIFQTTVGGYKSWDGDVGVVGEGRYTMKIPDRLPLDEKWLTLWGPDAGPTGLYYMVIHFIRFLPFMKKKSDGFFLQAWLLAHYFLSKIALHNIPHIDTKPLKYVFEKMELKQKPDTLWLEFGVWKGESINYISKFTEDKVYGFDSFEGLPEGWFGTYAAGHFSLDGVPPDVNENVVLVKGWFNETLPQFLIEKNKKISFIHIDCDIYSSTKCVLDSVKDYLDSECVIVFDELVNYEQWDGPNGEWRAFIEFINDTKFKFEYIGWWPEHESVALKLFTA